MSMSGYMAIFNVIRQKAGGRIPGINKHPLNAISHFYHTNIIFWLQRSACHDGLFTVDALVFFFYHRLTSSISAVVIKYCSTWLFLL